MALNSTLHLQCAPLGGSSLFIFPSKIGVNFEGCSILGVITVAKDDQSQTYREAQDQEDKQMKFRETISVNLSFIAQI